MMLVQAVSIRGEAPAQQPRLALPGRLRRALEGETTGWTLISGGLVKGVRSIAVAVAVVMLLQAAG